MTTHYVCICMQEAEKRAIESFLQQTCGCGLDNGRPCSQSYPETYYANYRADCASLSHTELDMLLKGHIISHISDSDVTANSLHHRHFPQLRKLTSMVFYHRGKHICRQTYLFLHNIGKKRYSNLKASVKEDGVLPRQHGNHRRVPRHAFRLEETQAVITFIRNYTEQNGIHLPGRIPGFKKTDIQLLPCHMTKKAVWRLYCQAVAAQSPSQPARQAGYRTFLLIWQKQLPNVIIGKPMTDLCWYCQKHTALIQRAINRPEEEKTQVRY